MSDEEEQQPAQGQLPTTVMVQSLQTSFSIEPFEPNNIKWTRWVDRFETAIALFDNAANKKVHLILHYMGSDAYNTLCDKLSPTKPSEKTYKDIVKTLTAFYDPEPNEIMENYRFHLRKQKDGETVDEFVIALRRLSTKCKFGEYLETALRNQFVFGLRNQRSQNRCLEKKNLTLDSALELAQVIELSEKDGAEIQRVKETEVNYVKEKNRKKTSKFISPNEKKCFRCGDTSHLANKCRFLDSFCHGCGQKGHLKKVCFKSKKSSGGTTNQLEEEEEEMVQLDELSHLEEIHQIGDTSPVTFRSKVLCELLINDFPFTFEIDTGSPVTVVGLADAQRHFGNLRVEKSDIELVSYCGNKLECLGFVRVVVKTNGRCDPKQLKMYITRSNRNPLLGREWLRQIRLDWKKVLEDQLNEVSQIRTTVKVNAKDEVEKLQKKYEKVFSGTTGKITELQARLHIKQNMKPVFFKARRVPFSLMKAVEDELDKLVQEDVLERVETSEWATPIVAVRKSNNKIRLCGDYKVTVNPCLFIDEYPLPSIDELFASMAGGEKFTKIDLSKAYLQLEIHPEDRGLLTLNTHKGLYRPKRMMFGIASAPAKWQRLMEQILSDIDGVQVFLDDIKITAPNDVIHLKRLDEVLQRLHRYNMRVNLDKSEFMMDQIEYCGYVIDRHGIKKMKRKIEAIENMKQPENKDEETKFLWCRKCEQSFLEVKRQMQSDVILAHYDPKLPLILATDASPYGVGAVLSHIYSDGSERPIQYVSQTLSEVQQRYSQIDREAYAIIFGIRRFYQYVCGRKFILVTDNKPISQIFSPTKGLPTLSATRMQHYAIFLESFDYEISCKRSKENANADAMSRLPTQGTTKSVEEVDQLEVNAIENLPVSVVELAEATKNDETVRNLIQALNFGRECKPGDRFGIEQTEFALQRGCLMRNIRVYIPVTLRNRVLNELHSAHFGMTKMKSLARGYCWWNNMDRDIEEMVMNCSNCQSTRPEASGVRPTHCWEMPCKPFDRVHVDFAGPFMGQYFFILVDGFSKWPEVHILQNITAETTIRKCREIFSTFGLPITLVSDWGSQFMSSEFQQFLKENGIHHKRGAPYHPATNGQVERYVQTVKNKLKAIKCNRNEIGKALSNILMSYRRAIHTATGKSPAMMMFGRQIRSKLDLMLPTEQPKGEYTKSEASKFVLNQRVAARDYLSGEKWRFGRVTEILGKLHYNVQLDDGRIWKRHADQLRKIGENVVKNPIILPEHSEEVNENGTIEPTGTNFNNSTNTSDPVAMPELAESFAEPLTVPDDSGNLNESIQDSTSLRHSTRKRQAPDRYGFGRI